MKKRKSRRLSKQTSLLPAKNMWVKLGRNLAYFAASFIFYFLTYTFRWTASFVRLFFSLFRRKKRQSANLSTKTDVKPLDRFGRLEVLMTQLKNRPIQDGLNIGSIIDLTDGCSEADLVRIIAMAGANSCANQICEQDFLLAISELIPSAKSETLKRFGKSVPCKNT